jgi:4-nitrophenyl phosphatase
MTFWQELSGVISDLDGVVYRGEVPIPTAVTAFQAWHAAGTPYAFVTNNSTQTAADFARKINAMGIPVTAGRVVTSAGTVAELVASRHPPSARVLVVGAPALQEAVAARGLTLARDAVDVVVVGLDRNFSYQTLALAQKALLAGAAFYATNADPMLPNANGFDPGAGSILRAIEVASGRDAVVVGKPGRQMIDLALGILGTKAATTLMIGDQIETDIVAGHAAGLPTLLVRTGVPQTGPGPVAPDFDLADLGALPWQPGFAKG